MQLFKNNYSTTLAADCATAAASMTVATGTGQALLGTLAAGEFYIITIAKADGSAREVVKVTSITGDALTITRAQESTADQDWVTGDVVECRITAEYLGTRQPDYYDQAYPPDLAGTQAAQGQIVLTNSIAMMGMQHEDPGGYIRPLTQRTGRFPSTGAASGTSVAPSNIWDSGTFLILDSANKSVTLQDPTIQFDTSDPSAYFIFEYRVYCAVVNNTYTLTISTGGASIIWENGTTCPAVAGTASNGEYYVIDLVSGYTSAGALAWFASYKKFTA